MVVPCAQLRVFSPRDTLAPRDRERWAPEVGRLGLSDARSAEERVTAQRLVLGRGDVPDEAVLVRRVGDEEFVCPLGYELRSAMALQELRGTVPGSVVEMLLPDSGRRATLDLVAASGQRPSIIDTPWAIPLAWFVLVSDDERRLVDPPEGAGPRLSYMTSTQRAAARVVRAVDVIDDTVHDADELLEDLADLAEWIDSFDPRALLELDYGGLAAMLGRPRLDGDHSARDVAELIDALELGDVMAAAARHAVVRARWSRSRALVSAS